MGPGTHTTAPVPVPGTVYTYGGTKRTDPSARRRPLLAQTMHAFARLALLVGLVVNAQPVEAGKVKSALFNMFGKGKDPKSADGIDADQQELMEWLQANGFAEFASKEWIDRFDEDLAYDSIEDLTHLVADDDYTELGIEKPVALKLQEAARKHMLKRFLAAVPLPPGAAPGFFDHLLEPLIAAGYDEPDDVADLEEDEAVGLGVKKEHHKALTSYADEYEARELMHVILVTYQAAEEQPNPFADEAVWRPIVNALVKAGVRSLADVSQLSSPEGITKEHLTLLKNDPRVLQHASKQEL